MHKKYIYSLILRKNVVYLEHLVEFYTETRKIIMAQLWGGRFTKETDQLVYNFNASISFDQKFYEQDIRGSKAHVKMLAKQGILTEEEKDQILNGLDGILADVKEGRLMITSEYEDIHSFVEANLIARIGDPGKKLHTGRSRNDQVALDMKLYTRDEIDAIDKELKELLTALLKIMEDNLHTYMPGFTHLQKAQPVTLAHHVGAYFEMFRRDRGRMADIRKRMNTCPLGAGALAGTTYPLDREYTAQLLGFDEPTRNSMDSVSDRDYVIELLSDVYKRQAIYRASAYGNLAMMYPMVSSEAEMDEIQHLTEEVKEGLKEKGIPFRNIQTSIMIETPAAVMISRELAKRVDFLSIGTNDLTQYTLAMDRQNPLLKNKYDDHHPAILRMIQMVVEAAHAEGKKAGICGEIAADTRLTETFVHMGVDFLSVVPACILPVRKALRETDLSGQRG